MRDAINRLCIYAQIGVWVLSAALMGIIFVARFLDDGWVVSAALAAFIAFCIFMARYTYVEEFGVKKKRTFGK